jgi:hypothetical protein
LDVTSLYTNIPHWEGLAIIQRLLLNKRTASLLPPNSDSIKLLSLVLTLNHFEFNGSFYIQKGGVAMGSKASPAFANLFMQEFEEKWVYTYQKQPLYWWSFIDDIKMVWVHGLNSLMDFLEHLNNVHPTIKFTMEHSNIQINFLDTTVKIDQNRKMYTTLYTKPTDTHTYLLFLSTSSTSKNQWPI